MVAHASWHGEAIPHFSDRQRVKKNFGLKIQTIGIFIKSPKESTYFNFRNCTIYELV